MRLALCLLVLSSCLAVVGPPVPLACTACASDEACDDDVGCSFRCDDETAPCIDSSLACVNGRCVEPCDDDGCDGRLACNPDWNRCYTSCLSYGDFACRDGLRCCNTDRYPGQCPSLGNCFQ